MSKKMPVMKEAKITRILGIVLPEGRYPPSMLLEYCQRRREHFLKHLKKYPDGIDNLSYKQMVRLCFILVCADIERYGDRLNGGIACLGYKMYEVCYTHSVIMSLPKNDDFVVIQASVYRMFRYHMQHFFEDPYWGYEYEEEYDFR